MPKLLRAAVIGAGSMGRNHARVYAEMEEAELVAVADLSAAALANIGHRHHIRTYTDYMVMLEREQIDLVSVVVPTEHHHRVVCDTLGAGIPTLVEKPIAATLDEGVELASLAQKLGVPLTVGHIERFNPAIIALKEQLAQGTLGKVYQIHVRRIGPFPARIKDVGVVIDLATHDLDIMHYLTESHVSRLQAEVGHRLCTDHEDLLSAVLRFENDIIGVLDINWLTPTKVRELSVIGERGMFVANYLTQELMLYENDEAHKGEHWPELAVMGVSEGRMIRFKISKKEPLRAELDAFVQAVRAHTAPVVRPEDSLLALAVAQQLVASGKAGQTIHLPERFDFTWNGPQVLAMEVAGGSVLVEPAPASR